MFLSRDSAYFQRSMHSMRPTAQNFSGAVPKLASMTESATPAAYPGAGVVRALAERPRILVVCTGNICRSPMGEIVLRQRLRDAGIDIAVASAGVSNEEAGNPIYPPAQRTLTEHGYGLPERHRAHRVTAEELENAGLILAMTTGHARAVRRLCRSLSLSLTNIHLWTEFALPEVGIAPEGVFGHGGVLSDDAGRASGRQHSSDFYYSSGEFDVPDPWGGSAREFEATLACVEAGSEHLVELLRSNLPASR